MVHKIEPDSSKWLAKNKYIKVKPVEKRQIVPRLEKETADNDTLRKENLSDQKAISEQTDNSKEHLQLNSVQKANIEPKVSSKEQNPSQPELLKSPDQKRSSAEESIFSAVGEPTENPIPERSIRKLALSVLAAPAYNGVNNLNNASLGSDFGLMVSFEVAKNWSLSTGGIYAKKLYDTGYRNYSPTKDIWTESYPRYVNADCRVLDIPLNISYTFLHLKNTNIGMGSGISSYIMLREDYRFSYRENSSNNPETYQVVNENRHWLSVLNLQATFEQRLNSRLSVSLQPYMKIPFKNIGFAGVKLQSFGMAANLSWNFNL